MMTAKSIFLAGFLAITGTMGGLSTSPALSQEAPTLPGGASSLQEAHEDWQIICQIANGAKQCAISQQQQQQNGQRVLAIELQSQAEGGAKGIAILPFGLKLQAGAGFQIDEGANLPAAQFSTCLPAGCIVPVEFDPATIKALRRGAALKLKVSSQDGQELTFTISLKGFSSALDRQASL